MESANRVGHYRITVEGPRRSAQNGWRKKERKELKPLTMNHLLTSLSWLGAQRLFTKVWHLSIPTTCSVQLHWLSVSKCTVASLIPTKVNPEVLQTWPLLHLKEIFPDLPM